MIADFIKDLIKYLPSKVVPGVFALAVIPLMTRVFSPAEYGIYTIVLSSIAVLNIMAADWIGTSVIRFYPEQEVAGRLGSFRTTIVYLTVLSTVLFGLVSLALVTLFRGAVQPALHQILHLGVLAFVIGVPFNVLLQFLVARRKANTYSLFFLWRQVVCVLLGLILVSVFGLGVAGMFWGIVLGLAVVTPFLFRFAVADLRTGRADWNVLGSFNRYGIPLIFTNLAGWVLALSDRYVIEIFRGSHEVGLYSISYNLADRSIQLLVSLVILSSAPIAMSSWEKEGPGPTAEFITELTRYYLIIAVPAVVGLSILCEPILRILTTTDYYQGYRIMPLVAGSIFLFGLQRNYQLGLLFHNRTKTIMLLVFLAGAINIALNLMFVPKHGFVAAGYTTLFSYAVFSGLIVIVSRKFFVWKFPTVTFWRVLAATAGMVVVIILILRAPARSEILRLMACITLGTVIYFLSLLTLREFAFASVRKVFRQRGPGPG